MLHILHLRRPVSRPVTIVLTILLLVAVMATNVATAATETGSFAERCALPGVVKCIGFDGADTVRIDDNTHPSESGQYPEIDTGIKASGEGSLKFTIPTGSGANSSGFFLEPMGQRFGENSQFYIQLRQRFSPEMFQSMQPNGGWKQVIFHDEGASCAGVELTTNNQYMRGFPQMYSQCGADPFDEEIADSDFLYQQGDYNCKRSEYENNSPDCGYYKADQWITFYWDVKVGDWGSPNSHVKAYMAYEGGPLMQFIDQPNLQLYENSSQSDAYSMIQLTPYHTNKDAGQTHPVAYTWYDELIVSTQPIPAPDGEPPPPPPPGPEPTVTLSADPESVETNGSSTLSWTSSNADSCSASGAWSGSKATSGSETAGPLASDSTFTLSCAGAEGTAVDSVTIVTVGGDTTPPEISTVRAMVDPQQVRVEFSEPVEPASAEMAGNYAISGGVGVQSAALASADTVDLETSTLSEGVAYVLSVQSVFDQAANPNEIAPGAQVTFEFDAGASIQNLQPAYYEADVLDLGKPAYVDRPWIYTQFDAQYADADYVRTANDDNGASGDAFVSFEVDRDVTVYVAYDARNSVLPLWLQSWTDTGDEIYTGEQPGALDAQLQLYAQDFTAGLVELGGNEIGVNSMYTVLVAAKDTGSGGGGGTGGGGTGGDPASSDTNSGGGAAGWLEVLLLIGFYLLRSPLRESMRFLART